MSFVQVISTYIASNFVILVAFALIALIAGILKIAKLALHPSMALQLHYFIFSTVIGLALLHPFLPKKEIFSPIAKVWVAPSRKAFVADKSSKSREGYISVSNVSPTMLTMSSASLFVSVAAILVMVLGTLKLLSDLSRLVQIRSRSFLVKEIYGVRIWVSEEIRVPFSFWLPGQKNIVMPQNLLGRAEYRIAALHELQHHRQQDTKWVYLIWLLKLVFVLNPIIHLWSRWVCEIQEFACDEALIGRKRVGTREYASCLIQVAQSALEHERQTVCATGLTFLVDRKTLKRRITAMLQGRTSSLGWRSALPIGLFMACALGISAYAAQGFVQDRRITMSQAQELARVTKGEDFPVVMNDRVLKWLNYFVGTPEGRDQVKAALARMENYRNPIQQRLSQYRLPLELMAIPLIESGYKNLEQKKNTSGSKAAGLWQFIPNTARNFGLQVDEVKDDRLDVALSSDAALRLLLSDRLRFNDWQLSILAYNAGETAIQNAINKTGSRDAWALIGSGLLSRENEEYIPKLMAGILIIRNSATLL